MSVKGVRGVQFLIFVVTDDRFFCIGVIIGFLGLFNKIDIFDLLLLGLWRLVLCFLIWSCLVVQFPPFGLWCARLLGEAFDEGHVRLGVGLYLLFVF